MNEDLKFNWNKWRTRNVWLNGKKVKLRHYIVVNANVMKQLNKRNWQGVDHYLNYKIALSRYGLPGLKHYENRFYNNVPMPYNQTIIDKIGFWFYQQFLRLKNKFK